MADGVEGPRPLRITPGEHGSIAAQRTDPVEHGALAGSLYLVLQYLLTPPAALLNGHATTESHLCSR